MDTPIDLNIALTNAQALGAYLSAAFRNVVSPSNPRESRLAQIRTTWGNSKWRAIGQAVVTPIAWATDLLRASVVGVGVVVGAAASIVAFVGGAIWCATLWVAGACRRGAERLVGVFNADPVVVVVAPTEEAKA